MIWKESPMLLCVVIRRKVWGQLLWLSYVLLLFTGSEKGRGHSDLTQGWESVLLWSKRLKLLAKTMLRDFGRFHSFLLVTSYTNTKQTGLDWWRATVFKKVQEVEKDQDVVGEHLVGRCPWTCFKPFPSNQSDRVHPVQPVISCSSFHPNIQTWSFSYFHTTSFASLEDEEGMSALLCIITDLFFMWCGSCFQ